jgi:hypothetical protein
VKIPKRVQKDAHAVILIGGLAFGKMCPDLARFIVANERGVKILVVVGEVCGSGFRRGRAVAGSVLAEIGDRQFCFARTIFQEIFQLGCAMHAWNLRQRNLGRISGRRRRDLCGNTRPGGTNDNNPKDRIPDARAHLGCLYITFAVLSRK